MVLLIKDHCPFCTDEIRRQVDNVLSVVMHPDGTPFIRLDDHTFTPLPSNVPGLPALIHESNVYVGQGVIRDFFQKLGETHGH